jgi:hypothetical protein
MDLDLLLKSALAQAPPPKRRARLSPAEDYARRLAEKALYRRLLRETHIAQDGLRFLFWFSGPGRGDISIDEWREIIDRAMK